MLRNRTIVGLAVVTLAVGAAALLLREEPSSRATVDEQLLPDLLGRLNDVARIEGRSADGEFTIALADGKWLVETKAGYPAEPDKIRRLLLGLADLRKLEAKTRKPELYPKLGLADPGTDGATALAVVLEDAQGNGIASVILGDDRSSRADPDKREVYVRLAGDPQSWLTEGRIEIERSPAEMLAKQVLVVPRARIRRASVVRPDDEPIQVERDSHEEKDYRLLDVPAGFRPRYSFSINDVATSFATLNITDVFRREGVTFDEASMVRATMETFDGLRVTLETGDKDGRRVVRLHAEFDPAIVSIPEASETGTGDEGQGDGEEAERVFRTAEEVREEAEKLQRFWSEWAFELPDFRLDGIVKSKADLIEPEDQPVEGASGSGGVDLEKLTAPLSVELPGDAGTAPGGTASGADDAGDAGSPATGASASGTSPEAAEGTGG